MKQWLALAKRAARSDSGTFLVEGERESTRLAHRAELLEWIWCEQLRGTNGPSEATLVSEHVFNRISRRQNPDGVAAVFRIPDTTLDAFRPGAEPLVLVADGIEKPGNVGAMIRTADALGASLIGSDLATDLVNPNVVRASQGSLLAVPTATASAEDAASWALEHTSVFVLRPDEARSLWDTDLTGATSIVVGSESSGVGPQWNGVGTGISIPMVGSADSLNASVAAAIVLAEACRQRSAAISTT